MYGITIVAGRSRGLFKAVGLQDYDETNVHVSGSVRLFTAATEHTSSSNSCEAKCIQCNLNHYPLHKHGSITH